MTPEEINAAIGRAVQASADSLRAGHKFEMSALENEIARLKKRTDVLEVALGTPKQPRPGSREGDGPHGAVTPPLATITRWPPDDARTDEYCTVCGESPDSGTHIINGHNYERPSAQTDLPLSTPNPKE